MKVKTFHARLLIRIYGDPRDEDLVQAAILKRGATIGSVSRRIAPNGSMEHEIVLEFETYRSLDEIIRSVGEVKGAGIIAVTLLSSRTGNGRAKEVV